ncbi:N-terminal nucleophile aminohydrolase [Marasmius fiardii PR-910]|nr:N-terminal nucleophile aminohydrolase [Marasmius fiardii PR-910]
MAFVAVHGGAGSHNISTDKKLKKALRIACQDALSRYDSHNPHLSVLNIVEHAIATLEDDQGFNAGFGSNLTLDGTVECDASLMDGNNAFGAVGAISGIKNPIRLAKAILEHSQKPDSLGRIPPLLLVSDGARSFATQHSIQAVPPESMIADRTKNSWARWKEKYDSGLSDTDFNEIHVFQDTVGAVAVCGEAVAAGVSSGGLLLKFPGRVGEAGLFGAGCWAQRWESSSPSFCNRHVMACSVSGAGEYITRASLARSLGRALASTSQDDDPHDIIHRVLKVEFWLPSRELGDVHPNVGILLLTREEVSSRTVVRLWCAFTTSSMTIAFASADNPTPKVSPLPYVIIILSPSIQAFVLRQNFIKATAENDDMPLFIAAYTL